jgi:hypothetical protein
VSEAELITFRAETTIRPPRSVRQRTELGQAIAHLLRLMIDSMHLRLEADRALRSGNRQLAALTTLEQQRAWKLHHLLPVVLFPIQQQGKGASFATLLTEVQQGTFAHRLQDYIAQQRQHNGAWHPRPQSTEGTERARTTVPPSVQPQPAALAPCHSHSGICNTYGSRT